MNKKQRINWFRVKLLCRSLTRSDIAKEIGVTENELDKLIKGDVKDSNFTVWVTQHFGRPYWL